MTEFFWERKFPMKLTGAEVRVLFTSELRYEVGRGRGRSHWLADCIRAHASELDEGTLQVLINDIEYERDQRERCLANGIRYYGDPGCFIELLPELRRARDEKAGE